MLFKRWNFSLFRKILFYMDTFFSITKKTVCSRTFCCFSKRCKKKVFTFKSKIFGCTIFTWTP